MQARAGLAALTSYCLQDNDPVSPFVPGRTFVLVLLHACVFALCGGQHTAAHHFRVPASERFMMCLQDEPPQQKQDGLSSLMQLASGAHYQMTSAGAPQGAMQPSQERSSGSVGGAPPGMYQRTPASALLPHHLLFV